MAKKKSGKSKEELIKVLVEDYGYDEPSITNIPEDALEMLLSDEIEDSPDVDFDAVEMEETVPFVGGEDDEVHSDRAEAQTTPLKTSPLWNAYVMSQFAEEELFNGCPTVDGLRRVTTLLIGDIVGTETDIKQVPSEDNGLRATAVVTVIILNEQGYTTNYAGAADAFNGNTKAEYVNYPVALAETRAEARALRRALMLKTVSADEVADSKVPNDDAISETQINGIGMLGKRLNVDISKLLATLQAGDKIGKLRALTGDDAAEVIQTLSGYQAKGVPDELKGYKEENWKHLL